MSLLQNLPMLVRSLPALVAVGGLVGVLIFLTRHPVDGEGRVIDSAADHHRLWIPALGVAVVLLVPTWLTLAVAILAVTFGLYAYQPERVGSSSDPGSVDPF